uniref:Obscurin, cytoskeletal calmodulin and titin-interacting RhoGEF b n=1 Tax=Callorhinchus milii TaxID=7868 RepID=A0A4W3HXA5_CALMI
VSASSNPPMDFGGAPRFLARPKAFAVSAGRDATLTCRIVGNPDPLVVWEKGRAPIGSGGRFKAVEDGDVYKLTIYDLALEDSGQYICRANNPVGEAYAAVTLKVAADPRGGGGGGGGDGGVEYPPYFVLKPSSLKVRLGDDAGFSCKALGNPAPAVSWERDNKTLSGGGNGGGDSDNNRYAVESAGDASSLRIHCARFADGGTWLCRARNRLGDAQAAAALVVVSPDDDDVVVVVGDFISVSEPKLPFKTKLQDVEVVEKEMATLQCEVPVSDTQTSWFLEETQIAESAKYSMEEEGTLRKLMIQNVTTDDDAVYVCEMKEGSRTVGELTVKGNIVKKLPRKTVVAENDTAIFCVELSHSCKNITWTKNGQELKPNDRTTITVSGMRHVLTIRECKWEDIGEITLLLNSIRQALTSSIVLCFSLAARKVPPYSPVNPVVKEETETSVTLAWSLPEDEPPVPVTGYIIEKKKIGSNTWTRCHSENVVVQEFTVRGVTEGGDYQFRISSINNFSQKPKASIKTPLQEVEVTAGEDATFTIELSTVAPGLWFLNGKAIESSESHIMQRTKNTHTLIIKKVRSIDNSMEVKFVASCVESLARLRVKEFRFVNKEKSKRVVTAACGVLAELAAETNDIHAKVQWYKNGKEVKPLKTFTVESKGKEHRLIISAAQKEDEGTYTCKCGDDIMTFDLKITGKDAAVKFVNKPKTPVEVVATASESLELPCEVSAASAVVTWRKDQKEVKQDQRITIISQGTQRKLVINKMQQSDQGHYTCVANDDRLTFQVKIKGNDCSATILKKSTTQTEYAASVGEKVTLVCEVSHSTVQGNWYRHGQEMKQSKVVGVESEGATRRLVLHNNVEAKDGGDYVCEAAGEKLIFHVTVTEPEPVFSKKESVQKEVKVRVAENTTLSCEVSQSKTEVKWSKDGKIFRPTKNIKVESDGKTRKLVIQNVEAKDGGDYVCEAAGEKLTFHITVTEPEPVFANKASVQKEVKVRVAENATLSCEVSQSKTEVKWSKDGKVVSASKKFKPESDGKTRKLVIQNVESKDGGDYVCEAAGEKLTFHVTVTEPEPVFANKDSLKKVVKVRSSENAALICEVSQSKTEVKWFKGGKILSPGKKIKLESDGKTRKLEIQNVESKDEGEYICEAAGEKLTFNIQVAAPKIIKFTSELHSVVAVEGEDAIFKCSVSHEEAAVTWHRNGVKIEPSKKDLVSCEGMNRGLTITKLALDDACEISLSPRTGIEPRSSRLREAPVLFKKKLENMTVEEKQNAIFEVELTKPCSEVKWIKNNVVIQPDGNVDIKVDGSKQTLTIKNVSFADRGFYSCETLHEKTKAKLSVESKKIQLIKKLEEVKVHEKETCTFEVELSHEDVEGTWLKDSIRVKPGPNCRTTTLGKKHALTLSALKIEDSGQISFQAEEIRTSGKLVVTELPVNFTKALEDIKVPEKEKVIFECELSRSTVDVKWFKVKVTRGNSFHYWRKGGRKEKEMGERRLVINNVAFEDEGSYACDAIDDKTTAHRVGPPREKGRERKIEIVKHLEDVETMEESNLVFSCELSHDDEEVQWYLNDTTLFSNNFNEIQKAGKTHKLILKGVTPDDTGTVKLKVRDVTETQTLDCLFREKRILVWRGMITLECEVSKPKVNPVWKKDEVVLGSSDKYELLHAGKTLCLIVHDLNKSDAGIYTCDVGSDTASAKVTIQGMHVILVQF